MTKVLVTGGAGFIGSHTVDLLLERGHQVRVLDNLQARVHPRGKPPWLNKKAEFIQGDVSDRVQLGQALSGVDFVFHLAAYQDYMPDFSTFIHTNTESAALLFELIVEKKLKIRKIVFASSQAVCGEGRYRCEEHGTLTPPPRPIEQLERGEWEIGCPHCKRPMVPLAIDEATVSPGTAYGISKYAIELLADRLGQRYDIPTVCMRYTYVQGPRNSSYNAYSGIARIFILRLLHKLPPICFEDAKQLRDYVNVRDVARANVLVMEDHRADFQVFNVGGGRPITVMEFADIVLAEFGSDLEPMIPGEYRLGDTRHTFSDISKLRALGWEPTIPVEQNVAEYTEWIKEQQHGYEYLHEAERVMRTEGIICKAKRANAR
ncbi:MAG: SDR family NAD(P)-dependent oxidoreductase [Acidobacteria bacterium]|nr:SDR family NAD(P)-dependent oxidoreductase [Acidobacteriota bacterium]